MSHDIRAYKRTKIAEMSFGAGNGQAREIYKLLGAENYDNGCSGSGENVDFTREEIKEALRRCFLNPSLVQEREFLMTCLDAGDDVTIGFW
jgi:hypothetical protein